MIVSIQQTPREGLLPQDDDHQHHSAYICVGIKENVTVHSY